MTTDEREINRRRPDWIETERKQLVFWKGIKKVSVHTLFPLSIFVSLALFAN